jgi:hypothetical protein
MHQNTDALKRKRRNIRIGWLLAALGLMIMVAGVVWYYQIDKVQDFRLDPNTGKLVADMSHEYESMHARMTSLLGCLLLSVGRLLARVSEW